MSSRSPHNHSTHIDARLSANPRTPHHGVQPADDDDRPTFELSLTQVAASTAAAVTAAVLGSRLGVAGTLIGAALASSVSMTAGAVYTHSLAKARYKVRHALASGQPADPYFSGDPTKVISLPTQAWGQVPMDPRMQPSTAFLNQTAPGVRAESTRPRRRRQNWLWAVAGAVAACALALLTITGIEVVRGTPISGGNQGGLSVLGGGVVGHPDPSTSPSTTTPASSESSTSNSTPSVSASTATSADATDSVASTTVTSTVTQTVVPPVSGSGTASDSSSSASSSPSASDSAANSVANLFGPTTTTTARPGGS